MDIFDQLDMDFDLDIETSIIHQEELDAAKDRGKQMEKDGSAVITPEIKLGGDPKKGAALMAKIAKLILRAYNFETKDMIRDVKAGNIDKISAKVVKLAETLSKSLSPYFEIQITPAYVQTKLDQLEAYHKHAVAKQAEKEAEAAIREEIREQEKAEKEHAKALMEAAKAEEDAQAALDKARAELSGKHGAEMDNANQQIEALMARLAEAEANKERAVSQAQLTKSGHIYVIKNTGSFGEDHYKVGMTRRLVPQDRIKELSNAAVPFPFAVCALFYAEDAPTLEKALHDELDDYRVNKVNLRKEHFACSIDVIEAAARKHGIEINFIKSPEEIEWENSQ